MSAFRKIAQDKHTSTLENSAGHQITIAHKALPRDQRSVLNALPLYAADKADPEQQSLDKGGDVKGNPKLEESKKVPDLKFGSKKSPSKENKQLSEAMQNKAPRKNYAEGDAVTQDPSSLPYVNPQGEIMSQDNQDDSPFTMGGVSPSIAPTSGLPDTQEAVNIPQNPAGAPIQANAMQSPPVTPPPDSQSDRSVSSVPPPTKETPPSDTVNGGGSQTPSFTAGYNQAQLGLKGLNDQQADLAAAQKTAYDKQIVDQNALQTDYKTKSDWLYNEGKKVAQETENGHISADHWWENHSKIATGLGIILAGFNPTNNPNAAIQFLKNNIEQDTQAQIAEMGKKTTLLGHFSKMFGDVGDAAKFTNALKANQLANEMNSSAAKIAASDPVRAAKLNHDAGMLQMEFSKEIPGIAMKQTAMQAIHDGHDPGAVANAWRMMGNEGMANNIEGKMYPSGPGGANEMADKAIPHDDINSMRESDNFLNKVRELRDWSSQHSGLIPGKDQDLINYGQSKANLLLNDLRMSKHQGVIKPSQTEQDQKVLDADPTRFFNSFRTDPKYKALEESSLQDSNSFRNLYKLSPVQPRGPNGGASGAQSQARTYTPLEQQMLTAARQDPNHPKAKAIFQKLGVSQ